LDFRAGDPIAIRFSSFSPWQLGTVESFPLEFLVVRVGDCEYTYDLAPDSPEWGLIGPPF
jgi:hypothetical protein